MFGDAVDDGGESVAECGDVSDVDVDGMGTDGVMVRKNAAKLLVIPAVADEEKNDGDSGGEADVGVDEAEDDDGVKLLSVTTLVVVEVDAFS